MGIMLHEVDIVKNNTIEAVHDDDIVSLITSLGIYDDFVNGKCHCFFCDATITIDSLAAIFPQDEKIVLCCDRPECYSKLMI